MSVATWSLRRLRRRVDSVQEHKTALFCRNLIIEWLEMKKHYLLLLIGIIFLSGCIGDDGGGRPSTTTIAKECYGEGKGFNTFEVPNASCCHGLIQIKAISIHNGECVRLPCPCYICTMCGDGFCGEGENWCNCEQDCPEPYVENE